MVEERRAEVANVTIAGFPSLAVFAQRRFGVAIRTWAAHRWRQEPQAQHTAQSISLFRHRIETRIGNRNARPLRFMEGAITTQWHLRRLANGRSVVALSCYRIGLLSYVPEGLEMTAWHVPATTIVAGFSPSWSSRRCGAAITG